MKNIVFMSLSIIALIIFAQVNAFACSCPTVGSVYPTTDISSDLLITRHNAKVVFSGEVVGINKISKNDMLLIKIEVKESWKEVLPKEITITTELRGCGYHFQVGTEYLIFANILDDGNLTTGQCLRNTELYKATEELQVLGEGNKPQKNKSKSLKNANL